MPVQRWEAPADVRQTAEEVKAADHPHLAEAVLALEFVDSKAFVKDRVNLGKVSKFSQAAKLWHPKDKKYDFCISLCADVWFGLLNQDQRLATLDFHLCRCKVAYEPEVVEENGKKKPVKDEWGRVTYTDVIKRDDEGKPLWKLYSPADIRVFTENIRRHGPWYEELAELKDAVAQGELVAV